jgi:hypothetical protein
MTVAAVDELDPATVRGLVARANDPQRERWLQQVRRTGACRHPIRLRGVVRRGDEVVYSTAEEPDRALMVRCGNRRAECCPSCAYEYQGDMWQLVYAGLAGGRKGVPESVAEHPQVFATLTAPSFGAVHTRPDDGRRCRCGKRHGEHDPLLGAAVNQATYDYEGAVLWNWHAPALWNRFVVELVRVLAANAGLSEREVRRLLRIAYAKVAEFQLRGLVHFHAIIRLDDAKDRARSPGLTITADELAAAIGQAGRRARFNGHAGGKVVQLHFGKQLHTRVLHVGEDGQALDPEQVAAYVAKYSCKGSHEQITRRGPSPEQLRENGVPEQLVQMAMAAIRVAERPGLQRVGEWMHMLGFRGHFVTKSRGYSTNLGTLRDARAQWRADRDQADDNAKLEDETTPVLSVWEYIGSGYLNPGDVLLAAGIEASIRVGREALLDLRRGPPSTAVRAGARRERWRVARPGRLSAVALR